MIGLDEDDFTKYCFDEALAYLVSMKEKQDMEEAQNNADNNLDSHGGSQNAMDFLTQDQFKADPT